MKVFAISDLHISFTTDKPMDIFGYKWRDHLERIEKDWAEKVSDDDIVLLAGDHSWAMDLSDAIIDLQYIFNKKGKKVLIKGNHDLWWQGITKFRNLLPSGTYALQNDSVKFGNVIFCGSRGWAVEGSPDYSEHDKHIYLREVERFKLALNHASKIREEGDKLVCLIHYPPFNVRLENSLFTELFESFKVDKVVYGHLHGKDSKVYPKIVKNGIEYILASCDLVDNKLVEVL